MKDSPTAQPYLTLFESELQAMAGNAIHWAPSETGSELYGLLTHGDRIVCMLATAPAKDAMHEPAYFEQDLECFRRTNQFLLDRHGVQFVGTWHSHPPFLGHPSSLDAKNMASLAARSGLRRAVEIILTVEDTSERSTPSPLNSSAVRPKRLVRWLEALRPWSQRLTRCLSGRKESEKRYRVRVRAFLYPDIPSHGFVEIPIRVLPGTSPHRSVLDAMQGARIEGLHFDTAPAPLDSLLLDRTENAGTVVSESPACLPRTLVEQWERLPERALRSLRVLTEDETILLSLEMTSSLTLNIAYEDRPPYRISGVYAQGPHELALHEVTPFVLVRGPMTDVQEIWRNAQRRRQDIERLCLGAFPSFTVNRGL